MTRILALAAALLTVSTGCTPVIAALAINAATNNPDDDSLDTNRFVTNATGTMQGDMISVGDFDRDLTAANLWYSDDYLDFDLHALDGDWAMIGGSIDRSALIEGETVVLGPDEHWVIGCSGPSEYNAEFDDSAEEVEITLLSVTIDEVEMSEITITAIFANGTEATAVVLQPRPEPESGEEG